MTETLVRPQTPWALRLVPPFPAIAHRILALVGKEVLHANELGDLVKMDPSFAAELLRFANSALFGIRGQVTSLAQAISLVGTDRVKTMATMVAMNRMVRSSLRVAALRKVWQHSLVTALIAEEAARLGGSDADGAYTTGLLHNLGTLGMMSAYPDEYSRMLEVSNDYGFDLLETERELFEIDHCAAGAYLAQDWDFPERMVRAIATHHDQPVAGATGLAPLIQVSWRLADTLGYAAFSPKKLWSWEELMAFLPHAGTSWLGESPDVAKARLNSLLANAPA